MKKMFFTLVFLLILGGAAFFLGWVQFSVPPGSWGVLRSKTHGIDRTVIQEGKIRWVWYKLIPNNVTITVFNVTEVTIPIEISGVLPSGDIYSAAAGLRTDFSYNLSVSVSFKLKGESLPALTEQKNLLSQEDLDRYITKLKGEIENHVRGLLWVYGERESALREAQQTGTIRVLETELLSVFPDIENFSCTVKTLRFPDFLLYEELRGLYRDYLTAQRSDLRRDVAVLAAETVQNRRRFDELANYGELLTKYPILLQYLALEKGFPPQD
jgi:hypothetical protein